MVSMKGDSQLTHSQCRFYFLTLFFSGHVACEILVSSPLALKEQSPNYWTAREFPYFLTLKKQIRERLVRMCNSLGIV